MQNSINQMVPPRPQGHCMGLNPMHSGPLQSSGVPAPSPVDGFPNALQNMQGPANPTGAPMYQPGGLFNRAQPGQMPPMPGLNPYQSGTPGGTGIGNLGTNVGHPSGMPPPPPGPLTHGAAPQ